MTSDTMRVGVPPWSTTNSICWRSYSLWASPAEKAARGLRSAERKKTGRPPARANARVEGNTTTIVLR